MSAIRTFERKFNSYVRLKYCRPLTNCFLRSNATKFGTDSTREGCGCDRLRAVTLCPSAVQPLPTVVLSSEYCQRSQPAFFSTSSAFCYHCFPSPCLRLTILSTVCTAQNTVDSHHVGTFARFQHPLPSRFAEKRRNQQLEGLGGSYQRSHSLIVHFEARRSHHSPGRWQGRPCQPVQPLCRASRIQPGREVQGCCRSPARLWQLHHFLYVPSTNATQLRSADHSNDESTHILTPRVLFLSFSQPLMFHDGMDAGRTALLFVPSI